MPSLISPPNVASCVSTLSGIDPSRMEWQSALIGCYLSALLRCWMSLAFLKASGATVLHPWFMSGIGVPLRLLRMLLPMSCGMGASLMSPIFEFGAVLPMCMCKRTRGNLWSHTWRSAPS